MYQIRVLWNGVWEPETFLTGARIYTNFKEATQVKKDLQNMSSFSKYKVEKINC